jgi:transcriptional regulator with XRE-family HTH domain
MAGTQRRGTGKLDPLQARAVARLESVRKERGLSQEQVAELSGLKQGHISRVLNGAPETAFWVIARIAEGMNVSLDWLIEGPRSAARSDSDPPASSSLPPAPRLPLAK